LCESFKLKANMLKIDNNFESEGFTLKLETFQGHIIIKDC